MADLRQQLIAAEEAGARIKLIATDGVFSMDGIIADLKSICDLADEFHALVMVDDSHSAGFVGKHGRGTAEYCGCLLYTSCILAGYSEVPCNVMSADEQKLAELALVENIQRENLTSIEEAKAYIQIMRSAGMTQEELAAKMGKSQSTIANKVRLLNLPDEIQEGISSRKITERHARALLSVEPDKQQEVYEKIVKKGKMCIRDSICCSCIKIRCLRAACWKAGMN